MNDAMITQVQAMAARVSAKPFNTQEEWLKGALALLSLAWNGKIVMEGPAPAVWAAFLDGYDGPEIFAAVIHLVATRTAAWPPTIAEVREQCYLLHTDRLSAQSAPDAWLQVLPFLRGQRPASEAATALSRTARRAVEVLGGIDTLAKSDRPDRDREAFLRVHEAFQADARARALSPLMGSPPALPAATGDR